MLELRVRKAQPARYGVAQRLKMRLCSHMHCVLSPLRALSRTRLSFSHATAFLLFGLVSVVSAEELRDPTRPHTYKPGRTVEGVPSFSVNAIFISDDRRLAIINGERVRVGDVVAGARVVSIEKEQVTLSASGKQFTARLKTRRP
ncbi:MAG: general secretion pathway protein GspB [Woeseiaceae bacterium]|nr:general secretion pathway protein GspB [Woeseiaceae bacterium]